MSRKAAPAIHIQKAQTAHGNDAGKRGIADDGAAVSFTGWAFVTESAEGEGTTVGADALDTTACVAVVFAAETSWFTTALDADGTEFCY